MQDRKETYRRPKDKESGIKTISLFTLMELWVVVAIIGILASIVLSSLSIARDNARLAVCKSNMKQIGILFAIYQKENEHYVPMSRRTIRSLASWADLLSSYNNWNLSSSEMPKTPLSGKDSFDLHVSPDD
jgi:prepilin-type N-terminal cleavage/methylation domain-containing protein